MDPSRHQDQISSVTNGRNGANNLSMTDKAVRHDAVAEAASAESPARRRFTCSIWSSQNHQKNASVSRSAAV